MWHGLEGMGWGWIGVGFLHMLVFWGIVIAILVGVTRSTTGKWPGGASAMDILRARYAKGELTRAQFEEMKRHVGEAGT